MSDLKIIAHVAYRKYGIPIRMIARFFGVGGSAVSMMVSAGEDLVKEKKDSIK